jgi:hypothetical protein
LEDFLQREGVVWADYEQWRVALGEERRASLATMKEAHIGGARLRAACPVILKPRLSWLEALG